MTSSGYIKWQDDATVPRSDDDCIRRQISDGILGVDGEVSVPHLLRQKGLEDDLIELKKDFNHRIDIQSGERSNASRDPADCRWTYSDSDAEVIALTHQRHIAFRV